MSIKADEVRKCIAVMSCGMGVQIEFHCGGVDFEAVVSSDGRLLEVACLKEEDQ